VSGGASECANVPSLVDNLILAAIRAPNFRTATGTYWTTRHKWTERSQPLKWTFEILVFKTSRSASSLADHAGNGKSEEGKRNEHEPERRLLLSSDQAAGKEDAQKEELQLHDSANYSKHRPALLTESTRSRR
jgi:hypothetical protein